jgi:hypothetical protein
VNGFGVSVPVLVDERFDQGGIALLDALLATSTSSGSRVGVYFEVYGVASGEPLNISVSVVSGDASLARRLTRLLGLTSEVALDVGWSEPAVVTEGRMQRSLALDLADLEDGEYELEVRVQRADGTAATGSRIIGR